MPEYIDDSDPFEVESGALKPVSGVALARQRILRLLFTEPGDIVHRPDLGGGLQSFRNKPPTPANTRRLRNQATRLLDALEFVESHEVDVVGSGGTFQLSIRALIDGDELLIPEVVVG